MEITSIKEIVKQKEIYFTYHLIKSNSYLIIQLHEKMIQFENFALAYLRIDNPFKQFDLEYQQEGLLDITKFSDILESIIENPQQSYSMQVINDVKNHIESIEEDISRRLIIVTDLPNNPSDDKFITQNDSSKMIQRIIDINDQTKNKLKYQSKNWQLLYIVQSTIKQFWNDEEKVIIKLGKTDKEIQEYIEKLKSTYSNRIIFKPLFAQRLYTSQNTTVDKRFHKKLREKIPNEKIYLETKKENSKQVHYEFYYLSTQFIDEFDKILNEDLIHNQHKYDNSNNENDSTLKLSNDLSNDQSQDASFLQSSNQQNSEIHDNEHQLKQKQSKQIQNMNINNCSESSVKDESLNFQNQNKSNSHQEKVSKLYSETSQVVDFALEKTENLEPDHIDVNKQNQIDSITEEDNVSDLSSEYKQRFSQSQSECLSQGSSFDNQKNSSLYQQEDNQSVSIIENQEEQSDISQILELFPNQQFQQLTDEEEKILYDICSPLPDTNEFKYLSAFLYMAMQSLHKQKYENQ